LVDFVSWLGAGLQVWFSPSRACNKAREQKQPSPEGVRQQGLRALELVEGELYE